MGEIKEADVLKFSWPDKKSKTSIYDDLRKEFLMIVENPIIELACGKEERKMISNYKYLAKNGRLSEGFMIAFIEQNSDSKRVVVENVSRKDIVSKDI